MNQILQRDHRSIRGTIRYTSFFDGFTYNLLKDRDFIELSMSYSF